MNDQKVRHLSQWICHPERVTLALKSGGGDSGLVGGRGLTRSRWILSKRASGVAKVESGVTVCLWTLDR